MKMHQLGFINVMENCKEYQNKISHLKEGEYMDIRYYEKLNWVEVPMWKALKMWSNNRNNIKCVDGSSCYFYNGDMNLQNLNHSQVKNGKWFIES
jgi:hypothetical protein